MVKKTYIICAKKLHLVLPFYFPYFIGQSYHVHVHTCPIPQLIVYSTCGYNVTCMEVCYKEQDWKLYAEWGMKKGKRDGFLSCSQPVVRGEFFDVYCIHLPNETLVTK